MTLLTPLYAAIAASIAIPSLVILYFLKLRRRDLDISSTLLWRKAIQDLQANAPFQKLRRNILLLLQLLALAAAILALGQPQFNSGDLSGQRHVFLIDRSASMSATDELEGGKNISRLDAAKEAAVQLVNQLKEPGLFDKESGDMAMVVAFDREASVIQQFTGDKRKLQDAIRSITPSDGSSFLEPAVRLARAQAPKLLLQDTKIVNGQAITETKIIEGVSDRWPIALQIFTDGRLPDAARATPGPADSATFHRFGKPETHNVGLVALRADREFDTPANVTVFAGIQNTDSTPAELDAQIIVEGVPAAIKEITIPGAADNKPGSAGVVFQLERPEGATIEVVLRRRGTNGESVDSFATDDRGWLVVAPAKGLKLALVTEGNLLFRKALETLPQSGEPTVFTPTEFQAALTSGKTAEFDAVILDGWVPQWNGKPNTLPPGRFLVLGTVPNTVDPASIKIPEGGSAPSLGAVLIDKGMGPPATMVSWQRDHRSLRSLNLDSLDIFESRLADVPPGSSAQILAESTSGPTMFELVTTDMRALVVPFDPMASDWPFEVGFIVFLSYATDYLGSGGGWAVSRSTQPGLTVSDRLPDKIADISCVGPANLSVNYGLGPDGSASFGPFPHVGLYKASWKGAAGPGDTQKDSRVTRAYAVNLLDASESDIRSAEQIQLATTQADAKPGETGRSVRTIWPWLLFAALGVIMLEWFVYNRKVHV